MIFKKSDSYAPAYNNKRQKERKENIQCDNCENKSSVTEIEDIQRKSTIE